MRYQNISVALFLAMAACAQEPAHVARAHIEAVYQTMRHMHVSGDYAGYERLFAEDGTFTNSALPEPLRGREAIRALAAQMRGGVNEEEWLVIDDNRLVFGWAERSGDAPAYRGISTFHFNDDGLVTSYEGMFDPATLPATGAQTSEEAIEHRLDQVFGAFAQQDPEAVAASYTEHGVRAIGANVTVGRADIERASRAGGGAGLRFEFTHHETRLLSPTTAIVHGAFEIPNATPSAPGSGHATLTLAKEGDEWLIAAAQYAFNPPSQ